MKTLVTGANGHVGANVVRALLAENRTVRAMVRETADRRALDGLDVEIVKGDLFDRGSLDAALDGCEVVYHVAALYQMAMADPGLVTRTAVEGTRNVLEAAAAAGSIRRIVYTSSVAAVGASRTSTAFRTEEDWNDDAGSGVYALAKTEAERLAWKVAEERGLAMTAVCPSMVLGPHDWKGTPSTETIANFLRRGMPFYWDGGLNVVDAEDVGRGHVLAETRGKPGERYLLTGHNLNMSSLCQTIASLTGLKAPRLHLGKLGMTGVGVAMRVQGLLQRRKPLLTVSMARGLVGRYGYYDCTKSRRRIGWEPKRFEVVLHRAMAWILERDFLPEAARAKIRLRAPSTS